MDKVSILKIRDKDEDQEALAIVRSVNGYVALTLSLEHEGDVQVAFTPSECAELITLLQQTVSNAQSENSIKIAGPSHQEAVEINPSRNTRIGSTNH